MRHLSLLVLFLVLFTGCSLVSSDPSYLNTKQQCLKMRRSFQCTGRMSIKAHNNQKRMSSYFKVEYHPNYNLFELYHPLSSEKMTYKQNSDGTHLTIKDKNYKNKEADDLMQQILGYSIANLDWSQLFFPDLLCYREYPDTLQLQSLYVSYDTFSSDTPLPSVKKMTIKTPVLTTKIIINKWSYLPS